MHRMCTPFTLSMVKTSPAFVSPTLKPNHDHHQSDCLFSSPYVSRKQSVPFWQKKGRGENSIPKKMRLRPSRHDQPRRHLFSISPPASVSSHPSCPNDANKIRINITHLVAAGRKHVSSRFLKGKVATDGRAVIPWRVGNIVAVRDCGSNSGGVSPDGRGGAVRQPEVTVWSQTGLSKPGWDSGRSLIH